MNAAVSDDDDGSAPASLRDRYLELRDGVAVVGPVDGGAVRVTGGDASSYLQSLVSADLDPLVDGDGCPALLLTPQGKLDVAFVLLRINGSDWLALTDASDAATLAASLSRFKIRVDVDLAVQTGAASRLEVRGPGASALLARELDVSPPLDPGGHVGADGFRVVNAEWPGSPGFELIGEAHILDSVATELFRAGAVDAGIDAREALRIECGVPRSDHELTGPIIPQEAFLDQSSVSFTKGCFLGQELVCRIDTRGHVNRYLRGLDTDGPVRVGASIVADGAEVGAVTSAALSPRLGSIALGYVRREVEPGAAVTVGTSDGLVSAQVRELPFG